MSRDILFFSFENLSLSLSLSLSLVFFHRVQEGGNISAARAIKVTLWYNHWLLQKEKEKNRVVAIRLNLNIILSSLFLSLFFPSPVDYR